MPEEGKEQGFLESFENEELKQESCLANFKSAEDLAKSYVELNKMASSRIQGVGKEDTFEQFSKKAEIFSHLPQKKEEYAEGMKITEDLRDLGHKLKLHPEYQLKHFVEEFDKIKQKSNDLEKQAQVEEWQKGTKEIFDKTEKKDTLLAKAYEALETKREDFEGEFKELAQHPKINQMLLKIGELSNKGEEKSPAKQVELTGVEGQLGETNMEKLRFVQQHRQNPMSPVYDKKHPDHLAVTTKFNMYVRELADIQAKKNIRKLPDVL